jgi:hypothetical protein
MSFALDLRADGRIVVTGTPPGGAPTYHRDGPYRIAGNELVTPVLNEGQPVHVRQSGDRLVLVITDDVWVRLRRE